MKKNETDQSRTKQNVTEQNRTKLIKTNKWNEQNETEWIQNRMKMNEM